MTKVLVVDPQPVFLLGMEHLLRWEAEFSLAGCCTDVQEAMRKILAEPPDMLILNPLMRSRSGLELIREIKGRKLPIKIVVLASAFDDEQTIEIMRLGVQGMLLKSTPTQLLLKCLRQIAAGGQWVEQQTLSNALEKMLHREAGTRRVATILTEREIEIMRLVAKGLSNQTIGEQLSIGEGTVKVHIHNIYSKLGISNRVDLTLYAQKKGLS